MKTFITILIVIISTIPMASQNTCMYGSESHTEGEPGQKGLQNAVDTMVKKLYMNTPITLTTTDTGLPSAIAKDGAYFINYSSATLNALLDEDPNLWFPVFTHLVGHIKSVDMTRTPFFPAKDTKKEHPDDPEFLQRRERWADRYAGKLFSKEPGMSFEESLRLYKLSLKHLGGHTEIWSNQERLEHFTQGYNGDY
ncbi:hypothetical protein [uncultured Dokdonia sp.]|uniref:hypothetical protein n=1 Tax=uncultured Dokdonia sp. TaxID=575653 RepID=UPI0026399D6C|nr:hypothetical protein [uncultured Dokdonia sp.]